MKTPLHKIKLFLSSTALILSAHPSHSEPITALNHSSHDWNSAEWTSGAPTPDSAIFLNANTFLIIPSATYAEAKGFRVGNVNSETATLYIDGGSLNTNFVVVGDAPNGNAHFTLKDGSITVANTQFLDFEMGNPNTSPDTLSQSRATISGGSASLGKLRFNLRSNREIVFSIEGNDAQITADSLHADYRELSYKPAKLSFTFAADGVSPLKVDGVAYLGEADQFKLSIDGSQYRGAPGMYDLIQASSINGSFQNIETIGFQNGANIYMSDNNRIVIEIK